MEKKNEAPSEAIAWILKLPEEGGAWGLGITEMVKSVEAEVNMLEAQRLSIEDQIKARKKLLRQTVKRAEKEAPLLYPEGFIQRAKNQSAAVAPDPGPTADQPTV